MCWLKAGRWREAGRAGTWAASPKDCSAPSEYWSQAHTKTNTDTHTGIALMSSIKRQSKGQEFLSYMAKTNLAC